MKYSLHIGLNRVDPFVYGGWNGQLNACEADARDMAAIAEEKGFQTAIMLSEEATLRKVLDQLRYYANLANAGDTIWITYSGHGGQLRDTSGDESDGLDETWVLFDGMVIDDLMHQAYAAFRKGVRIIVFSDSCHSGTMLKAQIRENMDKIGAIGAMRAAPVAVCREYSASFTAPKNIMRPRVKATVVLLSGCQDNQFSYDGEDNGLFTGTFLKVFDKGKFQGTYKELRRAIVKMMPPEQTPQYMTMGAKDKLFESSKIFSGR